MAAYLNSLYILTQRIFSIVMNLWTGVNELSQDKPPAQQCISPRRSQGNSQTALNCAALSPAPLRRAETRRLPKRAHSDRARSESKEGTWPFPPRPSEAARCPSTEDHQSPSHPPS